MPDFLIAFWFSLLAVTAVFVAVARRIDGPPPNWTRRLYQFFVLGAFLVATMTNVRIYILGSVAGNLDAYMGFGFTQPLINPLHFVVPDYLLTGILGPLWSDQTQVSREVSLMPLVLWKTMILDLVLGTCLYGAFALGIMKIVERKNA